MGLPLFSKVISFFKSAPLQLLVIFPLTLTPAGFGALAPAAQIQSVTVQPNFADEVVMTGLTNPTAIRFSADGRIFVAEKSGLIKVFDNLNDTTPTIFADISTNVYNFWDRGLLGMALDPNFPTKPYVYVLYTHDAAIGGTAPRWGTAGVLSDPCPDPPGATSDGCVASGRLSRLQASGNVMTGSEQVLVEGWCQQYPSHSIGSIAFGADGALYASGGEGASFNFTDYGQDGSPKNPCGDPPGGVGATLSPPTAEGGSLRSQDLLTPGDPVGLSGTVIRINPDTGAAMPDNPLINNSDLNARRIIAHGLRNPFRIARRPGTNEIWIGDVGGGETEEINIIGSPVSGVKNYGWPCYEGVSKLDPFDNANLNICENLYTQPNSTAAPFFAYDHDAQVVSGESCPTGSSSISGFAFEQDSGSPYPAAYNGAVFFTDYSRDCIWVMQKNASGVFDPANIKTFIAQAANPVDLQISPTGELIYVDFDGGTIHKVRNTSGTSTLPAPWNSSDIGSVGVVGSSSFASPTFTINGSGTDIWNAADSFHFLYQSLNGDGTITARVASVGNTGPWAKSGVMIRESLNPSSAHAMLVVTPGNGVAFQRRRTTGAGSIHTSGNTTATAPYWVRLVRSGNLITAFQSANGTTWSQVGTDTISMTANIYVGLAVTSQNNTTLSTSTFDNVTLTTPTSNKPPVPVINSPLSSLTWKVGDPISFSGSASDPEDGLLPASALSWDLIMNHCPSNCHTHLIQTFAGVASGTFSAPDHEYPSYLELKLTAKDSKALSAATSVNLNPKTAVLSFQSTPVLGLLLSTGSESVATAFNRTVILGSNNSVSAPPTQALNGVNYNFLSWSDTGAASHNIVANQDMTLTANYQASGGGGQNLYLSDLPYTVTGNGWGPVEKDRSNGEQGATDGHTITLNSVTYSKGLGAHAASDIRYNMAGKCSDFTSDVGLDDEAGAAGSIIFQVFIDNVNVYDSGLMTGTTVTKKINLTNLSAKNELKLIITNSGNGSTADHGDWADAKITCTNSNPPPVTSYLSDLAWVQVANGWGPVEKDRSNGEQGATDGHTITLNGVTFAKGLGGHANSEVTYNMSGKCTKFTAAVGVDDEAGTAGSVIFQVLADGTNLFDSGLMTTTTATKLIDINVSGKTQLRLLINNGGNGATADHGDWADAKITCT